MKKGWTRYFVFLLIVVMSISLLGCDTLFGDDDDDKGGGRGTGELNYDGETVALTQLWFDDYGLWNVGVYNVDLYIGSDDLDFQNESGNGYYVALEMFFSTSNVSAGTYTWSTDETAGTFSDYSDITTVINGALTRDDLTDGTVTIQVSGSTYTITGPVTTDAGHTGTFSYVGPRTGNM